MCDATTVLHMHMYVTNATRTWSIVNWPHWYILSYVEHGYYPCLEPAACILPDLSSRLSCLSHRAAPVIMAKGPLSQLSRCENVQNMKRVPSPDSILATLAWSGQEKYGELRIPTLTLGTQRRSKRLWSRSSASAQSGSLHAYNIRERTIVPLHVIQITCLSRYFPKSVCTAVYGIGYSLSLYYLLLI